MYGFIDSHNSFQFLMMLLSTILGVLLTFYCNAWCPKYGQTQ